MISRRYVFLGTIVCSNCTQRVQKIHEDTFAEDTTSLPMMMTLPRVDNLTLVRGSRSNRNRTTVSEPQVRPHRFPSLRFHHCGFHHPSPRPPVQENCEQIQSLPHSHSHSFSSFLSTFVPLSRPLDTDDLPWLQLHSISTPLAFRS